MAKKGKFLGMPYDWRRPTKERLKSNAWDKDGKIGHPAHRRLGLRPQLPRDLEAPDRALRDGPCWARTNDLEIKSLLLYQLS